MKLVILLFLVLSFISPPFRNLLANNLHSGAVFAVDKASELLKDPNIIQQ